jgi:hypothetical protein
MVWNRTHDHLFMSGGVCTLSGHSSSGRRAGLIRFTTAHTIVDIIWLIDTMNISTTGSCCELVILHTSKTLDVGPTFMP